MNVYTTYALPQCSHSEMMEALKMLGHKQIFIEKWVECTEFILNDVKIEVFKLIGWGWLIEFENVLTGTPAMLYSKLVSAAESVGFKERDLTNTEPAVFLFKKKYS